LIGLLILFFACSALGYAQAASTTVASGKTGASTGADHRTFFPKNFIRGYAEFEIDPPHNERDFGRCLSSTGSYGGAAAACAAFGRYALGGYLEIQPFGRKLGPIPLQRLFFFLEPNGYFGRNVPQLRYTASADPILLERSIGVGIELPKDFELRWWQHRSHWLGNYGGYLGPADLGKNGPYGLYSAVSVRWYFGGYNRRR
jgi:hypothetical protein